MKTHWKKLTNPDYLGAYDFQPKEERLVTVKEVRREMVTGSDGKKEECTVIRFSEPYKPFIVNATNAKMISRLCESPYIEDWAGKSFILYVSQVKAFGDLVDALRVKDQKATTSKPELTAATLKKMIEAINSGQGDKVKAAMNNYSMTDQQKTAIETALKNN